MLVRTVKSLREGFESTGTALTAGEVSLAQARWSSARSPTSPAASTRA